MKTGQYLQADGASFDWKILVVPVSPGASDSPAAGHFYWSYRHLWEIQSTVGLSGKTIARKGQKALHLRETLGKKAQAYLFAFGLSALIAYRPLRIEKELRELSDFETVFVTSYDGGFSDFLVFNWLANRNRHIHFVFNFHWPLQWLRLLSARSVTAKLLKALLRTAVAMLVPNLTFAVETKQLSDSLRKHLQYEFVVFPVITSFRNATSQAWSRREIDLLCLPQRQHELAFSRKIVELAQKKGIKAAILADRKLQQSKAKEMPATSEDVPTEFWGPLSEIDYMNLLKNSRTAILPYDKDYGPWMSSGKFNDAVFSGCFPFVPSETAMASQSSISEFDHWYVRDSENNAVESVSRRLESGFPNSLRAKDFRDLHDFLLECRKASMLRAEQKSNSTRPLLIFLMGLLFSLYRETPIMRKASEKIRKYFDYPRKLLKINRRALR